MAQKGTPAPVNFIIRDASGQQKVIKVVQSGPTTGKQGSIQLPAGLKTIFKVPTKPETSSPSNNTIYRAVNLAGLKAGSKLVSVPMQTIGQMQKLTVVNASQSPTGTIKKVQTQGVSGITKVVNTVPALVQQQQQQQQQPQQQQIQPQVAKASNQLVQILPADNKAHISSILKHGNRKRHDSENESLSDYSTKRRRAADKVGKGLRHFSMKVCEKVKKKGYTSYNEVADELVAEFTAGLHNTITNQKFDQKNIRRRVYDALNVLMAMNIISKEKKEIRWLGLPTNSTQECTTLEKEKEIKLDRIRQKTQQLHDLIFQQISFKSLVERNRQAESKGMMPTPSSAIQLPFIVINTDEKALIDCSISNDKMEYVFNFNQRFQIYDDIDILKKMGLLWGLDKGECSDEDIIKAKSMVPKALDHYIDQLGRKVNIQMEDILKSSIKREKDLSTLDIDEDTYGTNYSDEEEEADSTSDVDVN